jgi:NTE family protein
MSGFWKRRRSKDGPGAVPGGLDLGERPWLVLGGGGLKGLAHLGVARVLESIGFRPAGILGTSIGALVGACLAGRLPVESLIDRAGDLSRSSIARWQRRALWMNGVRAPALFRGDTLQEYLGEVLPSGGWESLEIRFQANAVELGSGRTEWFGIGARTDVPLDKAIYASAALPVFYPPVRLPGGVYADGGIEDALPLQRAADLGATGIIAVDTGAGEVADGEAVASLGMIAVHERVFSIMSGRRRREMVAGWKVPPLLYIRPRLDGYGTFDFKQAGTFVELGERAAREKLGAEEDAPQAGPAISRTS